MIARGQSDLAPRTPSTLSGKRHTCRMSRENVDLVKALQPARVDLVEGLAEADAGGDFLTPNAPADSFADDFEVEWVASSSTQRPHYRGLAGMIEGWRDWLTPWASYRIDAEDFLDAGDEVVVLVHVRAKTSRDGVVMEHSPAAVWTIEDGKVIRIRFFLERDIALVAAGLPKQASHSGLSA